MNIELARILALPRGEATGEAYIARWTTHFARPGGEWAFREAQALALEYAERLRGGLFPLPIGSGKTALSFFLGAAAGFADEDVLIVSFAKIRDEMVRMAEELDPHFHLPRVRVVSYEFLSAPSGRRFLLETRPKIIILDEAHALKNPRAARTRRFLEHLRAFPDTRVIAMTATLTPRNLHDYAHLAERSLREHSPLPAPWQIVEAWHVCLRDPAPGDPAPTHEWAQVRPLVRWHAGEDAPVTRDTARAAFQARFTSAPGVVVRSDSTCDQPIYWQTIGETHATADEKARLHLVRDSWRLPNGDEIEDPLRLNAKLRQLSQGFFYTWETPPSRAWMFARSELGRAVTDAQRAVRAWDGRAAVFAAIEADDPRVPDRLRAAWEVWARVRTETPPETRAVWEDDAHIQRALSAANALVEQHPGGCVLWYSHRAVADRLEAAGVVVARAGEPIPPHSERAIIALSVASHGTGLNAQAWTSHVVLCPPANGPAWEQLVGRSHRSGRTAPVYVVALAHTRELRRGLAAARRDATYLYETQGIEQKLRLAVDTGPTAP